MSAFGDDLRFANASGVCVELITYDGQQYMTGVHEVDPDENWVSLYAPQHFGDDTTRRRVEMANIASVVVTNVNWS